jgi:predicted RNase H-like HicB family nuclease
MRFGPGRADANLRLLYDNYIMKMNLTVVIERDEEVGMYVGEVPGLPGCHTQGKTIDELMKNMREVIELCTEMGKEKLKELPKVVGIQQIEVAA